MHRVDAPGATAGNLFTNGDPTNGIPATRLEEEWHNAVQEEICNAIEDAGLTLAKGTNTQLKDAIMLLAATSGSVGQVIQRRTAPSSKWLLLDGSAVSRTTYADLWNYIQKPVAQVTNSTNRITITGHGLLVGDAIKFSWTGQNITANNIYYVKTVVDANNFTIAVTDGGVEVDISGDATNPGLCLLDPAYGFGDGSTTFNLEDSRGVFYRGAGTNGTLQKANSSYYDGGRHGVSKNDQMFGHWHDSYIYTAGGAIQTYDANGATNGANSITSQNNETRSPKTDGTNGTPRTGDENVPVHRATRYWVKAVA